MNDRTSMFHWGVLPGNNTSPPATTSYVISTLTVIKTGKKVQGKKVQGKETLQKKSVEFSTLRWVGGFKKGHFPQKNMV